MKENVCLSIKIEPLNKINSLISRYVCNVAATDVAANTYVFSKEVLKSMIPTLKGSPILTYYLESEDQFLGHEGDYFVSSKTGKMVQTPELSPVGFVDYMTEPYFNKVDEKEWLCCVCYLWDGRYPFLENLSERTAIGQSMEVYIDYEILPNGNRLVKEAEFLGLALIGVAPAFAGSTFEKFSSSESIVPEIDKLKKEFENFVKTEATNFPKQGDNKEVSIGNSNYDEFDYDYASELKEEYKEIWSRGGNIRGNEAFEYWQKARDSEDSDGVESWIREREAWCARHFNNKNLNGVVAQIKWGMVGSRGIDYMRSLIEKEKEKYKNLSYMSKTEEGEDLKEKAIDNFVEDEKKEEEIPQEETLEEDEKEEDKDSFGLTTRQIKDLMEIALCEFKYEIGEREYNRYWIQDFDEEYIYACDEEFYKTYAIPYTKEGELISVTETERKEVINGGYKVVEITQANEHMSANQNVDNGATEAMLEKDAEENKELADEQIKPTDDSDNIIAGLSAEIEKLKSDLDVYMKENEALMEFKRNIEEQNMNFEVETTLSDIIDILPKEEIDECRTSAKEFTLENVEIWKNEVRAKAFKFSKGIKEESTFVRIPLVQNNEAKANSGHLW